MLVLEHKRGTMKLYRITNQQGYFIRDDFTYDEETEIGLDVEASQGLYLPKWNFELETWVEGLSAEEIALIGNQPIEETQPIEARVEKLELEQEQVIDLLAQVLGV